MTPETKEHLDKARQSKARGLLDVLHYNDEAGRAAYLAAFHAARRLSSPSAPAKSPTVMEA